MEKKEVLKFSKDEICSLMEVLDYAYLAIEDGNMSNDYFDKFKDFNRNYKTARTKITRAWKGWKQLKEKKRGGGE